MCLTLSSCFNHKEQIRQIQAYGLGGSSQMTAVFMFYHVDALFSSASRDLIFSAVLCSDNLNKKLVLLIA